MIKFFKQMFLRFFPESSVQRQLFFFGVGGGLAFVIYFCLALVFHHLLHWKPWESVVVSFALTSVVSFTWHRVLTFKSDVTVRQAYPSFVAVQLLGMLINASLVSLQIKVLHWPYIWCLIAPAIVAAVVTYFLNKCLIFKNTL